MKPLELKREIEKHLDEKWTTSYDRDTDKLRIVDPQTDKGVTVNLAGLTGKMAENKEKTLEEILHTITEGMQLLSREIELEGNEQRIYPVLRSASFPVETDDGRKLLYRDHTAETRILYVVDNPSSYAMIDEDTAAKAGKSITEIEETALFNLRSLPAPLTEDTVAGNTFYFLRTDDGYDASRILNDSLLQTMSEKIYGEMAVAVPHQDVVIFADLQNKTGYDVLGQMAFQFFSEGRVPITALPFLYDQGELEPIFVLAQKKPQDPKKDG
ncbi:DUF1444 family protein [Salisediminibacterium halotolerans]|uniref:DUF1444 family protein n=1 Tax=Salisediminibacterium halotolerans TaxID=517425 RepID=UPI000EB156F7|nr:DUF1444 family protein [Salisediminibacterium halotolerans]RLJ69400.1 uncharacterized protein YtpQ (UPF0354 family) [Actinophytocola xinjiangensis]RPE83974.1 uncharacterized protein YtpQ (UPF0354 family) [Salisediminibacterium halotolerans]TWG32475.1 uncharacterized protein YtpQ (UPF0354 family) [Salisediminibacterium halotolerans]GEL08048.1 UPF0354 protein [Salisediminibacterium halotolerans]